MLVSSQPASSSLSFKCTHGPTVWSRCCFLKETCLRNSWKSLLSVWHVKLHLLCHETWACCERPQWEVTRHAVNSFGRCFYLSQSKFHAISRSWGEFSFCSVTQLNFCLWCLCWLTLNILGVEVGQPSSRALLGSLPLTQHTWWWSLLLHPRDPSGVRSAGLSGISPSLSCPTTHAGAAWGNPPLSPRKCVARHGAPRKELCGITWGSHDMPGPFVGLFLPLRESS